MAPLRRRGAPAEVSGDLNVPLILPGSLEVKLADQHICSNSCAGFAADTCSGPFKRPTCRTGDKLRHDHLTHPTGVGNGSGLGPAAEEVGGGGAVTRKERLSRWRTQEQ